MLSTASGVYCQDLACLFNQVRGNKYDEVDLSLSEVYRKTQLEFSHAQRLRGVPAINIVSLLYYIHDHQEQHFWVRNCAWSRVLKQCDEHMIL